MSIASNIAVRALEIFLEDHANLPSLGKKYVGIVS